MLGNSSTYNLGESLFKRSADQSLSNYTPNYAQALLELSPVDKISSTMQKVNSVCGDNFECRFDFVITLDEDIAVSTMRFYNLLELIYKIFSQ